MNTVGIIELAVSSNVGLFVKDGQLGVRADKGALSDELKGLIKQHKDEIIAYLSGMAPAVKLPSIKALGSDKAPLSYAQQRLWFVDKLNGGGKQYNMAAALSFSGKLDVEACNRAFSTIIQRHSILRTNYVEEDGEVFQCIRNAIYLPLTIMQSENRSINCPLIMRIGISISKKTLCSARRSFTRRSMLAFYSYACTISRLMVSP